jgi:hypothetical protein
MHENDDCLSGYAKNFSPVGVDLLHNPAPQPTSGSTMVSTKKAVGALCMLCMVTCQHASMPVCQYASMRPPRKTVSTKKGSISRMANLFLK